MDFGSGTRCIYWLHLRDFARICFCDHELFREYYSMTGNQFSAPPSSEKRMASFDKSTDVSAYFCTDFDAKRRRLTHHYLGFWNPEIARRVLDHFRAVLESAAGPKSLPFTLLDDCRKWELQSKEVADLAFQFAPICAEFPITRNAMIVPSSLVRMQVRRTLTDIDFCEVFETYEQADRWLAEVEPRLGV